MEKISQKRINNRKLTSFLGRGIISPNIEKWNKGSLRTFTGILKTITGYDDDLDICFYDDDKFTFSTDKIYTGHLEQGDPLEEMPKIKISSGNTTTTYEVLSIPHDNETFISLDSEKTTKNGKTIFQMFAREYSYFSITIEDVTYKICVYNPNANNDKIFELPYEKDLKESLNHMKKSTNLDDIIILLEYYLGRLDKYPKVEVTRSIMDKKRNSKNTDEFVLKNGQLDKYMQTKRVGTKSYVVKVQDDRISCNIENVKFDDEIKPDTELIKKSMQYVKKYPKI